MHMCSTLGGKNQGTDMPRYYFCCPNQVRLLSMAQSPVQQSSVMEVTFSQSSCPKDRGQTKSLPTLSFLRGTGMSREAHTSSGVHRQHVGKEIVVQSLGRVRLFATPCTVARQASLSFTIFWSWLKLMSVESMMPSNHLILCRPLCCQPLTNASEYIGILVIIQI